MAWVSQKTAEEVVPCGGQGRGLGEDMRSLQAAACVGGKVMGEDKKSDQLPALKRPPRAQGGEQMVGHPPSRGLAGAKRVGHAMARGPQHGAGLPGESRGPQRGWGRRRRAMPLPPEAAGAERGCRRRAGDRGAGDARLPRQAAQRGARASSGPGGSPSLPAGGSARARPAAAAAAGRRGCGRPAWEGLSGGPSPGADGAAAAAAAAAIRRRGSRCPAWEGPCCIAAAALLPLRAHNGDSQPQQRLRRRRRERAGPGRPAGARRRQQHAG